MFRPWLLMTVLFGCAVLGCGLRQFPLVSDGGPSTGGAGGLHANGGTGGLAASGGRGGGGAGGGHPTDGGVDVHACTGGDACMPVNPCHIGQTTCSQGVASCTDTEKPAANGTACGTDMVCSGGSCVSCTAGGTCTRSNPCEAGTISCSSGAPKCVASGPQPQGTVCGSPSCPDDTLMTPVCDDSGSCVQSIDMACPSGLCLPDQTNCLPPVAGMM